MQGVRRYHEGGGARGRRAGFAFISAVIFLGVVLLLGASMVEQSNQELATASRAKKDTQAFNLAEAGIDYAAWRLYCDRAGTALPVTWTRTGMGGGDFSVTASQYGASSDTVVLDSTGTAQGYTARVKVVGKFLTQPTGPQSAVFDYGLFSNSDLTMGGTFDITGAVHANGNVTLQGGPSVDGDVSAIGSIKVKGSAHVTGDMKPLSPRVSMPVIDVQYYRSIASQIFTGDKTLSGTTTLDGVTFIDGNVQLSGQFKGKGVIVVKGNVHVNGSALLDDPGEDEFAIVATGKVKVNGTCRIEGWVYTHNVDVPSVFEGNGTADIYGGVAADLIQCNGTLKVHYREATLDLPGSSDAPAQFDAVSWRRLR